jgi:hypothetical protein
LTALLVTLPLLLLLLLLLPPLQASPTRLATTGCWFSCKFLVACFFTGWQQRRAWLDEGRWRVGTPAGIQVAGGHFRSTVRGMDDGQGRLKVPAATASAVLPSSTSFSVGQ